MPAASDRKTGKSSSSRGRARTQSAQRSSGTKSSSQRRPNGARSKSSSGARSKGSSNAQSKSRNGAQSQANGSRSAKNHQQQDHVGREALTAAIGATVGVAGGVLLSRKALARERKVLGVPMPKKIDLAGVSQQIGEAGRQFGRLAGEVRGVREKAEQIGRVLS
jgi:hypothetical protein